MYTSIGFFSNRHLNLLYIEMKSFLNMMRAHQLVQNLTGITADQKGCVVGVGNTNNDQDPAILRGEYFDVDVSLNQAMETNNGLLISFCHFLTMFASFMFNDYAKALKAAMALEKSNTDAYPPQNTAYWMLFQGIASISVFQNSRAATKCLKRLKTLAKHAPFNYNHFATLLEAEILFHQPRCQAALSKYSDAAMEAKTRGFPCIEALAYERSASVYQHLGRRQDAYKALKKAQWTYQAWGAHAKACQIVRVLSSHDTIIN
jgi:tetratricopeptide (TPR) repeat protein